MTGTDPAPPGPLAKPAAPSMHRAGAARPAAAGMLGGVLGFAPHLLHHVGWFAGAAVFAGLGGTLLFGVLGLVAMVPMLLRLRRRFAGWWVPGVALAGYALMFAVSATVLGPALRDDTGGPVPVPSTPADGHPAPGADRADHHR